MTAKGTKEFPRGVEVVGSVIIENAEGKILLVKSPKWHNKWTLPGGHIEPGEKLEEALLREAREEVGLNLVSHGVISFGELINSKDFTRSAHFVFFDLLCSTRESSVTLDGDELTEYAWVKPTDALSWDLAESYTDTLKKYVEYKRVHS